MCDNKCTHNKMINESIMEACSAVRANHPGERKCFVQSYGCQMNDYDAERLTGMLMAMGYDKAETKEESDIIIYNTCCVREHAEKRVFGNIGALKKLKEEKPSLKIAVCGCMMQQEEVATRLYNRFPFVDLVFGTHELERFPEFIDRILSGERILSIFDSNADIPEGLPITRLTPFSTNVIVMYGCDNFCTYCVVPYVRGRERSRRPEDILAEIEMLASDGYKEITLLGQNVNSYHSENGMDFADILKMANDVQGIERVRFMTSHPKDLSPRLIDAMANLPKVCNHIHLPVQSGSNRILDMMNRRYTRERYLELVAELRARVPEIEITTDIIVGFPTETDADFQDTVSLVREVGYAAAYTFMYSPRPKTPAAEMKDQVAEEVKRERLHMLNEACAETLRERNRRYLGSTREVLVEGCDMREEPMAFGKLTNFKMVYFPGSADFVGKMLKVRITDDRTNSLIGEIVD